MRMAAVQMNSGVDRAANVARGLALAGQAADAGAELVVLPEYMTYLGPDEGLADVAEPVPGPTTDAFADLARRRSMAVVVCLVEATSNPARFGNTAVVIDRSGNLQATYRKVHMFDVDVPDGPDDKESNTIEPGTSMGIATFGDVVLGLSICFDLRFPEQYRALARAGANVFAVPSAFYDATGRAHWEVLLRARAIENHAYVLAGSQHSINGAGSRMHGNAMIVDPWGVVLDRLVDGDGVVVADIDPVEADRRRGQIPVLSAVRPEVYAAPPTRDHLEAPA